MLTLAGIHRVCAERTSEADITQMYCSGNREVMPTRFLSQVRFLLSFQFHDFTHHLVILE